MGGQRRRGVTVFFEAAFVGVFVVLGVSSVQSLFQSKVAFPALFLGAVLGWLLSDLLSGLAHFCADNFGSEKTPLVGRAVIAPFREHHRAPEEILKHGFVERNGWNCAGASLICGPCLFSPFFPIDETHRGILSTTFLVASLFVALTNQIHAWAHATVRPPLVEGLQRVGLILSPTRHRLHHHPYELSTNNDRDLSCARFSEGHYCITSGICDRVLAAWRRNIRDRKSHAVVPEGGSPLG